MAARTRGGCSRTTAASAALRLPLILNAIISTPSALVRSPSFPQSSLRAAKSGELKREIDVSATPPRLVSFDKKLTRAWSNPSQAVLSQVGERLWMAERPFYWNSIDVGSKMAVAKLRDGSLWVHSPVPLDDSLRRELEAIGGEVKAIVAPNLEHVKGAAEWKRHFPDAKLYGCPQLKSKEPDIGCDVELDGGVPEEWSEDFDIQHLDYEINPFTRSSFFNEIVFWHKPSATLVVSDLFWNYPVNQQRLRDRMWKFGMDQIYQPFYQTLMIGDRARFLETMNAIFAWPWESILPCHGSYVESKGKRVLAEHLGLLK